MVGVLLDGVLDEDVLIQSVAFPNYGLIDHWVDPRTHAAIALGGWDYVIMQQGPSGTEGRPSLLEFTKRFEPEIRAAGAEPAVYMVWPSDARRFDFELVSESHVLAAEGVNGLLFPAADAWQAAWQRDAALQLYGPDGFHPSVLGSFLAALTIADRLVDGALPLPTEIRTATSRFPISPELAAVLLESAREAIAEHAPGG